MKVLISAPSLDSSRNVSGVSTVVRQILSVLEGRVEFRHLKIGSEIGGKWQVTLRSLGATARAAVTIVAGKYDVFHSNTALNSRSIVRDTVLMLLARARVRPVILHLHGGRYIHDDAPPFLRGVIFLLLGLANRVIVLSRIEKSRLVEAFPAARDKTHVIYNGVDVSDPPVRAARAPSDDLNVGFVGRLVEEKGVNTVLAAAAKYVSDPRIRFLIFGDGPLRSEVLAAAKNIRNISYRGVFDSNETKSIFASIDILVLPSLHGEGMPMAILEAMAAGAVPYATAISSVPEIVEDRVTGFLTRVDSEEPLAVLEWLVGSPDYMALLSKNALSFAQANFDARVNYGRLLPIYEAVVPRS